MGYGDAYVYAVIITPEQVTEIKGIKKEIKDNQKKIDKILQEYKTAKTPIDKRGQCQGLFIDNARCYERLITACKNPIAIYHVASDDWLEAWEKCSGFNYKVVPVKTFLSKVKDKLWCGADLDVFFSNATMICIPSHYDIDDELLSSLGIKMQENGTPKMGIQGM
jgi:hypothetical protein